MDGGFTNFSKYVGFKEPYFSGIRTSLASLQPSCAAFWLMKWLGTNRATVLPNKDHSAADGELVKSAQSNTISFSTVSRKGFKTKMTQMCYYIYRTPQKTCSTTESISAILMKHICRFIQRKIPMSIFLSVRFPTFKVISTALFLLM